MTAKKEKPAPGPLCHECKFSDMTQAPALCYAVALDLVSGEPDCSPRWCYTMRREGEPCSPSGKLYEPKEATE